MYSFTAALSYRQLRDTVNPYRSDEDEPTKSKNTSKSANTSPARAGRTSADLWNHHTFSSPQPTDMNPKRTSQSVRQFSASPNRPSLHSSSAMSRTGSTTSNPRPSLSYTTVATVNGGPAGFQDERNPLDLYLNLSSIQKKLAGEVNRVLEAYTEGTEIPPETKRRAIVALLDDLDPESPTAAYHSWRSQRTLDTVFSVLKLLARRQVGTEPLSREKSLRILAFHAGILQMSTPQPSTAGKRTLLTSSQLPPNAKDAFRTLCNTLYLHSSARLAMSHFPGVVKGLAKFTRVRDGPEKLGDYEVMFLVLRTFLLICSDNTKFIRTAVEEEHVVDYLVSCLEAFARQTLEDPTNIEAEFRHCTVESMKLIYTFTSFYARMDHASPTGKEDKEHWTFVNGEREKHSAASALSRASSPFGRRWGTTMAGGANDAMKLWKSTTAAVGLKKSNSLKDRSRDRRKGADKDNNDLTDEHLFLFQRLIPPLVSVMIVSSSSDVPTPPFDAFLKHVINGLMYFPLAALPSDCINVSEGDEFPLFLSRFLESFDSALETVMSTEENGRRRGGEEGLIGFMYILRKMAKEHDILRGRLRNHFLPGDIDRTTPLSQQTDTFYGRLLALMRSPSAQGSVTQSIFEFFLTLCDRNLHLLCEQIGQVNVEKFVKDPKSLKTANWKTKDGREVDGRTGAFIVTNADPEGTEDDDEMSPEDREAMEEELESMMSRLDRMNVKKP
ncbi:hypothetical protein BT69DRAFT_1320743 [Atractiella rhizophila]|nr:hypothetical protein BT69DRAFT_1320743 [Atractiella rhizophila]